MAPVTGKLKRPRQVMVEVATRCRGHLCALPLLMITPVLMYRTSQGSRRKRSRREAALSLLVDLVRCRGPGGCQAIQVGRGCAEVPMSDDGLGRKVLSQRTRLAASVEEGPS